MNAAHLHLISVHFPVVLVPFGLVLFLIGLRLQSKPIKMVALCTFVVAAMAAGAAFLLGEGAEEVLEDFAKISHSAIEEHEEAADWALWLTIGLGLFGALGAFSLKLKDAVARPLVSLLIVLGLLASASLAVTAQQGGKIRHPEAFDGEAAADQLDSNQHSDRGRDHSDHDDD